MTKEQLLAFVTFAPIDDLQRVRDDAYLKLVAINAVSVGFRPIPKMVSTGTIPDASDVLAWIETVRQPAGAELSDRAIRNRLVYEVEKLGEFSESLQERILSYRP